MKEPILTARTRVLLEDFESAFSYAWDAAQDILIHIDSYYDGNKEMFLDDVAHSCDYFTTAKALKAIFDFSEK